jgi:cytochrome P450
VRDEIKQYLWAGIETTALTLGWTLYLVSRRPEVADKIRREADEVYGTRSPTAADMERLSNTRSVMLEALRLYPPAWALIRTAVADDEIAGHKIKAGDRIVLCPYVIHHDAKYWEDPEEFRPERFEPGRGGLSTAICPSARASAFASVASSRRWRSPLRSRSSCAGLGPSTLGGRPRALPQA